MIWVTQEAIDRYAAEDPIGAAIGRMPDSAATRSTCHAWLADSLPKRFIFDRFYGDLLDGAARLRVLDIGGGLTGFTETLARRHDYTLVDLMAHDDAAAARDLAEETGNRFLHVEDWHAFLQDRPSEAWDVVIANDLFPNVDQRLVPFLEAILPVAGEVRVSLTYYNDPRWYVTRRIDADEILTLMAWDGTVLSPALRRYADRLQAPDFEAFGHEAPSVYANGRQVCLATLSGDC